MLLKVWINRKDNSKLKLTCLYLLGFCLHTLGNVAPFKCKCDVGNRKVFFKLRVLHCSSVTYLYMLVFYEILLDK